MGHGRAAILAMAAVLAACSMPPQETPEQAQARRSVSCQEAGFTPDTQEYRLCLLLQQTNERLDGLDRRLSWIEQDVRYPGPFFGRPYWW